MIPVLTIILMALNNTFRGGRFIDVPGRNLYVATPLTGLIAWISWHWTIALAWAVTYLFWGVWSWGHIIGLGYFVPDRPIGKLDKTLLRWAKGNVLLAMYFRELFILPGVILLAYLTQWFMFIILGVVYAALASVGRELAWRTSKPNEAGVKDTAIRNGEIIEGAVWGALISLPAQLGG